MLCNLNEVLKPASEGQYAVGLFNTVTLEMADGIMNAAEKLKAPVIMGTAEILLPAANLREVAAMVKARALYSEYRWCCITITASPLKNAWRRFSSAKPR